VRVEAAADPGQQILVLFVMGVGDAGQELSIAVSTRSYLRANGQRVFPRLILKAGFTLMTDREDEGNVRTRFVGIQRYVAALTVRDHELAQALLAASANHRMAFEDLDAVDEGIDRRDG